jgi:hypothetical protein
MRVYVTAALASVLTAAIILYLLRARQIREKYAVAWIALAGVVVLLGIFPDAVTRLATFLGVETPINLVFLVAILVLLMVSVQFSVEISKLEEETRTLAEELALTRLDAESGRNPGSGIEAPVDADPDI